jgi:hypothetical protein
LRARARQRNRARGRPSRYGVELQPALERLWLSSDRLCGKLLTPVLPTLRDALERHHGLTLAPDVRTALPAASPATLDRSVRPLRRARRR